MIFKKFAAITMACLCAVVTARAHSRFGSEGGNGGDDNGIEFQSSLLVALKNVPGMDKELAQKLSGFQLPQALSSAKIMIVDGNIYAQASGIEQNSVAVTDARKKLVLIHRDRWSQIRDAHLKEALALHETLILRNVEATGVYTYSAQYLALFNLSAQPLRNASSGELQSSIDIDRLYRENQELQKYAFEHPNAVRDQSAVIQSMILNIFQQKAAIHGGLSSAKIPSPVYMGNEFLASNYRFSTGDGLSCGAVILNWSCGITDFPNCGQPPMGNILCTKGSISYRMESDSSLTRIY